MKLEVKDEILDYSSIAILHKLKGDYTTNVPTHIVHLHVDEWPVKFTNAIRYILMVCYPTVRLVANVSTTDPKLRIESTEIRLKCIHIASSCPAGAFKYDLVHDFPVEGPIYVTLEDSSIGKYINHGYMTVLAKGRSISITGEVKHSDGLRTGDSDFYFASSFARDYTEFHEYEKGEFLYNKGHISFIYDDIVGAEDVMTKVMDIFKGILMEILGDIPNHLKETVGNPYLIVPKDRSQIIAQCLTHYIYEQKLGLIYSTQAYQEINNSSIINFPRNTKDEVEPLIIKGIKKLLADIDSL